MKKIKKWIIRKLFKREIKALYSAFEDVANEVARTQLKTASRTNLKLKQFRVQKKARPNFNT